MSKEYAKKLYHAFLIANPEYAERQRAKCREYEARQKELGRRRRKCPDGSRRSLTDEEFDRLYSNSKENGRCD
jgi:hypothetical protein